MKKCANCFYRKAVAKLDEANMRLKRKNVVAVQTAEKLIRDLKER